MYTLLREKIIYSCYISTRAFYFSMSLVFVSSEDYRPKLASLPTVYFSMLIAFEEGYRLGLTSLFTILNSPFTSAYYLFSGKIIDLV